MRKTIYRPEYKLLLRLLKERRERAGLTQVDTSLALGKTQSFISDLERGVRRLDVVQLRDICRIYKTTLVQFVKEYERELGK